MLLHAYPINEAYSSQLYANQDKEYLEEQADPGYVKKLEYSADKFASSSKHKHSSSKKIQKKPDRSAVIDNRSKDYFEIRRSDRKNTLSGHKRTNRFNTNEESPGKTRPFLLTSSNSSIYNQYLFR